MGASAMTRAILVLAVLGMLGCGGGSDEPRSTGPAFGTICYSDACTSPEGSGSLTVYSYDGSEVARCASGPDLPETCWTSTVPAQEITPRDLAACRGSGPRAPCP